MGCTPVHEPDLFCSYGVDFLRLSMKLRYRANNKSPNNSTLYGVGTYVCTDTEYCGG